MRSGLDMPLLNPPGNRALKTEHRDTFSGIPVPVRYHGRRTFYRLLGNFINKETGETQRNDQYGVSWFSKSVVDQLRDDFIEYSLLDPRPTGPLQPFLASIRNDLAVSYEWNSFDSLVELTVPEHDWIRAWAGLTKWQLEFQRRPDGRLLDGSFIQYVIYDVRSIPAKLINKMPLQHFFRTWSRQVPSRQA